MIEERIVLDTNCLVSFLDDSSSPRGRWLAENVFARALRSELAVAVPSVCLAELLVRPFSLGQDARALAVTRALVRVPNLQVVPLDDEVAVEAARLRGRSGVSLPDAVILATAVLQQASVLTNDRRLATAAQQVPVTVLLLDDARTASP